MLNQPRGLSLREGFRYSQIVISGEDEVDVLGSGERYMFVNIYTYIYIQLSSMNIYIYTIEKTHMGKEGTKKGREKGEKKGEGKGGNRGSKPKSTNGKKENTLESARKERHSPHPPK